MNIRFSGLERAFSIHPGKATLVIIENSILYTRVCQSLLSNEGEQAVEPYSLWDDGDKMIPPKDVFLGIADPFNLPWGHRMLSAGWQEGIRAHVVEDDEACRMLEALNGQLRSKIADLSLRMHSDYAFAIEWDMLRYLKTFGYGVDLDADAPLFDNIMKFLSFVADSSFSGVPVFINLGTFLSTNQVQEVRAEAIFLNLSTLFLENRCSHDKVSGDSRYLIDQDLLEY